jgi:hypothetical protein
VANVYRILHATFDFPIEEWESARLVRRESVKRNSFIILLRIEGQQMFDVTTIRTSTKSWACLKFPSP